MDMLSVYLLDGNNDTNMFRNLYIFNCSGLKESRCVYESAELNECAQTAYFHHQPAGVSVPLASYHKYLFYSAPSLHISLPD